MGSVVAGLLTVGLLGGCHGASEASPANFTKGIAKYLVDHPDCLYPASLRLPYETSDKGEVKQLDTLVAAKLLANAAEPAIHVTRYTVTDYGQKARRGSATGSGMYPGSRVRRRRRRARMDSMKRG